MRSPLPQNLPNLRLVFENSTKFILTQKILMEIFFAQKFHNFAKMLLKFVQICAVVKAIAIMVNAYVYIKTLKKIAVNK